jgi:hypothetical protein
MNVNKFTSKETLVDYIEQSLNLKNVEVSKLFEGDKIDVDTGVLFQIRVKGRLTLRDLSIIGIMHKDVSFVVNDEKQILLTWIEE